MGSFLSLSQKPETTLANPNLHLAPSPAQVSLRDGSKLSLGEFLETRCPSALKVFKPSWWLFNGHLQTAFVDSFVILPLKYLDVILLDIASWEIFQI